MSLTGAKLVGDNPERGRVENDYYATPFNATEALLNALNESGSIVNELSDMYIKEGYDIRVDRLVNGLDTFTGYRFTVIW